MQTMVNDLERIADIFYQISRLTERMGATNDNWPESATSEMAAMMDAVRNAIQTMKRNAARETRKS